MSNKTNELNTKEYLEWKKGKKIDYIDISKIKLVERKHTLSYKNVRRSKNVKKICEKLKKVKRLNKPIVVREIEDGNYQLIVGIKGLSIADNLKHSTMPCIVVECEDWDRFAFMIGHTPSDCEQLVPYDSLIVPQVFKDSVPSKSKVFDCLKYYEYHKTLDKSITIDENNVIVNGYIRYVVANILKLNSVPIKLERKK